MTSLPTDTKDLGRRIHRLVCLVLNVDDEDHENDEETKPIEEAIQSLILQETTEARKIAIEDCWLKLIGMTGSGKYAKAVAELLDE